MQKNLQKLKIEIGVESENMVYVRIIIAKDRLLKVVHEKLLENTHDISHRIRNSRDAHILLPKRK